MLHLIYQAPLDRVILDRIAPGDEVVFLEAATQGLLKNSLMSAKLTQLLEYDPLYVMSDALAVRGILEVELIEGIQMIDYEALVTLTVKHSVIQSWT
jgi:sulfur relay protein TusB/DsrH